jgi:hypothetical protein
MRALSFYVVALGRENLKTGINHRDKIKLSRLAAKMKFQIFDLIHSTNIIPFLSQSLLSSKIENNFYYLVSDNLINYKCLMYFTNCIVHAKFETVFEFGEQEMN